MIACNKIQIDYGRNFELKSLCFSIKKGQMVSLVGPNGSGKTTVLKAMSRLLPLKSGYVYLDGMDINKQCTRKIAKKMAVLSQHNVIPPDFTVEELVSYGRVPHRGLLEWSGAKDKKIVEWAMCQTGIESFSARKVNTLSGGERQKVWIAMALAQEPDILLLDEPTTFLDICHQLEVMELVRKLNLEYKITVLMVLHDLNQAAKYSQRMIALKNGRIVADGSPDQVLTENFLEEVYCIHSEVRLDMNTGKPFFNPVGLLKK